MSRPDDRVHIQLSAMRAIRLDASLDNAVNIKAQSGDSDTEDRVMALMDAREELTSQVPYTDDGNWPTLDTQISMDLSLATLTLLSEILKGEVEFYSQYPDLDEVAGAREDDEFIDAVIAGRHGPS